MPRFYFHIRDKASFLDTEGTELTDTRAAQLEAVRLAGAVITNDANRIDLGENWCMEVVDQTGVLLFRLDFHILAAAAVSNHK